MSWSKELKKRHKRTHEDFRQIHTMLLAFLSGYISQNPEWAFENIPNNAMIQVELAGDSKFNAWSKELASQNRTEEQEVFVIVFRSTQDHDEKIEFHPTISSHHKAITAENTFY
ncbi:MAG: hypothetical protein HY231_04750 [Acidobacteria bacterium]|nr:hypothetical protein [Acidobacteriota bacterium]